MIIDGITTTEGVLLDAAELASLDGATGGNYQEQIDSKMDTTLLAAMDQDIIPSVDNVHSLGSLTHMWKDVYIGPGSLYINGQKLIEDNAGTINIHPDLDQNLSLTTSGIGDVELAATGSGTIQLKSNIQVTAGKNIVSSDGNPISVSSGFTMSGEKIENMATPTIGSDAATKAYTDAAVNAITSGIDWKEAVTNFADLATTYPTAVEGWTASVNSEDTVYRYDGASWVALANGTVPLATGSLDGKMSSSDFTKLQGIEAGATADQSKADIDALGINAGTLDGVNSSQFLRNDVGSQSVSSTFTIRAQTGTNEGGELKLGRAPSNTMTADPYIDNYLDTFRFVSSVGGTVRVHTIDCSQPSGTFWHSGNDGTGSGLDADKLDGQQGSYYYSPANLPPASSPIFVSFNGADGSIRSSNGIASVTRNGTGDYTVNFTTPFANANYCVQATSMRGINTNGDFTASLYGGSNASSALNTNWCRIKTSVASNAVVEDGKVVNVTIFA